FKVLAIGPGLGRSVHTMDEVRHVVASADLPVVIDGDALHAIDERLISSRSAPTILTPHDGEFTALVGVAPDDDRIDAARTLARRSGAVVLLKGPTTVIADPSGEVVLVDHGDERLATAGSGDVLTGVVTGAVSGGAVPFEAASMAAWMCAEAGRHAPRHGAVASDVLAAVPGVLDDLIDDEHDDARCPTGQNVER
ncbi:MAG: NAD(P)H-hydrate dehydratase, partial [Actinobacteria bacterium]|nr:NAD(P)H-hydrate dehydratase [Actinomycetota bacterium]